MGPSELSFQSSRVPKVLRPGIRSFELSAKCAPHLGTRAHCVAFGRSARSRITFLQKEKFKKVGAGWWQGSRWYERAGERPERTQAVGLKEWRSLKAGLQLAERASYSRRVDTRRCALQIKSNTAAGRRAGLPNELHPKFELAEPMAVPNIPAQIHPNFILTSQSVVIKTTHLKLRGPNAYCH